MKLGKLDATTSTTFAWIKNRPTAAERETKQQIDKFDQVSDQTSQCQSTQLTAEIIARNYRADKGRIRRLGEKLVRLLAKPKATQVQLLGPEWFERIE